MSTAEVIAVKENFEAEMHTLFASFSESFGEGYGY